MKKIALTLGLLAVPVAHAENTASLSDWMSRTEVGVDAARGGKPAVSIETVQPLYQTKGKQNTMFTQLRASSADRFGERRNTFNLGLGYRQLMADNTALAGVNLFYDYEDKYSLKRWSLGGDLRWNAFDLYANKYYGISGWTNTNLGAQEKPLSGYDVDLAAQIPYMPWAKAHVTHYKWNKERAATDLSGNKLSLDAELTSNVTFELGRNFDSNNASTLSGNFMKLAYRWDGSERKQPNAMKQFIAPQAFEARDMSDYTLEKVRRTNNIVVERSAGGLVISRAN